MILATERANRWPMLKRMRGQTSLFVPEPSGEMASMVPNSPAQNVISGWRNGVNWARADASDLNWGGAGKQEFASFLGRSGGILTAKDAKDAKEIRGEIEPMAAIVSHRSSVVLFAPSRLA